jgi:hypothetical protein
MTDKFKKRLNITQSNDASSIGNKRGKAKRAKRNSSKRDRQRLNKELTLEIVYVWQDGREEVRYRRTAGSEDAQKLIDEVEELKSRLKEECPYFYREV